MSEQSYSAASLVLAGAAGVAAGAALGALVARREVRSRARRAKHRLLELLGWESATRNGAASPASSIGEPGSSPFDRACATGAGPPRLTLASWRRAGSAAVDGEGRATDTMRMVLVVRENAQLVSRRSAEPKLHHIGGVALATALLVLLPPPSTPTPPPCLCAAAGRAGAAGGRGGVGPVQETVQAARPGAQGEAGRFCRAGRPRRPLFEAPPRLRTPMEAIGGTEPLSLNLHEGGSDGASRSPRSSVHEPTRPMLSL
jgi:hypothetical protein